MSCGVVRYLGSKNVIPLSNMVPIPRQLFSRAKIRPSSKSCIRLSWSNSRARERSTKVSSPTSRAWSGASKISQRSELARSHWFELRAEKLYKKFPDATPDSPWRTLSDSEWDKVDEAIDAAMDHAREELGEQAFRLVESATLRLLSAC